MDHDVQPHAVYIVPEAEFDRAEFSPYAGVSDITSRREYIVVEPVSRHIFVGDLFETSTHLYHVCRTDGDAADVARLLETR